MDLQHILPIFDDGAGNHSPVIIAGPCSAETEAQVLDTARSLAACGVGIYRAGIWKPRTKPGGFEGVGEAGLEWLRLVKEETGMKVATEVATAAHVEAALDAGIDLLWIGARTTANPFAMQDVADVLSASGKDVPVLVKNPVSPDLELWIGALERIYNAGMRRIGAIHRGFSTYGEHVYRNSPQWRIPLELRIRYPHLPIICDPSHIGGRRDLIAPLAQEALDMGFDGLIIESHCNPEKAWSDAAQQVTPQRLDEILKALKVRNNPVMPGSLTELRTRIDALDAELLDILAKRMEVSREIGQYKSSRNMPVVQSERFGDLLSSRIKSAAAMGMSDEFVRNIFSAIHEESVRMQIDTHKK